jgi:tetratricopeptide (TPR) repeat protein
VFAGGADLEAITAVTCDILDDADPLELIADLVDASLANIGEDDTGEPRVGMLETIRSYARDRLHDAEEAAEVHLSHLIHFATLAQQMSEKTSSGRGERLVEARSTFVREQANFREALGWALTDHDGLPPEARQLGVALCLELVGFWKDSASFNEAGQWLDAAIRVAHPESRDLGHCLTAFANILGAEGQYQKAIHIATTSVALWRRLDDQTGLARALLTLGITNQFDAVRTHEEALALARQSGDEVLLSDALVTLALTEGHGGNLERCLELLNLAITIAGRLGHELRSLEFRHMRAVTLRFMGRLPDAHREMNALIPPLLRLTDATFRIYVAEDYAAMLAELGDHMLAARLNGAADTARSRNGTPRDPGQQAEIREPLNKARTALGPLLWQAQYERGQSMTVEDALTEAQAATARG